MVVWLMILEKMFTWSNLHWKFNHSSIRQPIRGGLRGSLLGGLEGGGGRCHIMPFHSRPAMASRGVLINNSTVQATVERAAEDVSQVAFLHWAQCQPALRTTETADSLGVEEGVSDREAAVCLLPLPHHWLHYRSRLYTSTTSVSNNHFTVVLLFIHGICSWPKHENE